MYIHISVKLFSQFVYLQMYCHRKYRIIYAAFEINVLYLNLFSYSVFCIQCTSPPPSTSIHSFTERTFNFSHLKVLYLQFLVLELFAHSPNKPNSCC